MKKIIMIVEGMTDAQIQAALTDKKLQTLLGGVAVLLKADQCFFGAGQSAPLSEVEPRIKEYAASLN